MADNIIVTVTEDQLTAATTGLSNPSFVESIGSIGDVDLSTNGKVNGSILVYNTTTNKWTSTTTLDAQNVDCGEF